MRTAVPAAATVGEIARRLAAPVHRVEYIIRTRGLRPGSRAGRAGIYDDADVQYIAAELRRIAAERGTDR